jgi:hypothetical protein
LDTPVHVPLMLYPSEMKTPPNDEGCFSTQPQSDALHDRRAEAT